MPLPDSQSMMLPVLRGLADGQIHRNRDLEDVVAVEFGLTVEERFGIVNKNGQSKFANRLDWTVFHLFKAGLVERSGRGMVRISGRGLEAIKAANAGDRIDMRYLNRFPEYSEFRARSRDRSHDARSVTKDMEPSPEALVDPSELLEASFFTLRAALADELLERIRRVSPRFFERLVLDLLVAMGYGGSREDAAEAVGGSGDDGIDGIIKEDRLGLDSIYLQAKRWENPVGRPVLQAFAGSLQGHRARKGVFITTSRFSQDAREYVDRIETRIVLIDGERPANLMIDHGVGVADVVVYPVKRIDEDYFEEA